MKRAILLATFLVGCHQFVSGSGGGITPPDRSVPPKLPEVAASTDKAGGETAKVVAVKKEGNVLVAEDATQCEVTRQRWNDTPVGSYATCAWKKP